MKRNLLTLLIGLFCCLGMQAANEDELMRLEAEMLNYISTSARDTFYIISDQLKEASKEAGNERLFYKAWSKQALYEATHQNFVKATEISKELADYAQQQGSVIGKYFALHAQGAVLMQQDDYEAAEPFFLKALEFRHQNFPEESAAEDLRELIKIAYESNDNAKAKKYAHQLLSEPNLEPHHKGRTLYRLSIIAFDENDVEEFNHIYDEMKRLVQTDGIRLLNLFTEVNYHIINGDYRQALRLSEWLAVDTCAERKAIIYHRMGDNEKAYEYMVKYKHLSDSITHSSHSTTVANLYLRMNNDRLRLERAVLRHQNSQLNTYLYIVVGIVIVIVLLLLLYKGSRILQQLKDGNWEFAYDRKDAARALEDLKVLSTYESKDELPLTFAMRPNELGSHLMASIQPHCHKGVSAVFQTELSDDLEIKTNPDELRNLLRRLIDYSARFTRKGTIKLSCVDDGKNILFSVADTSLGIGNGPKNRIVGMFSEHGNIIRYVGMNFNICQSITRLLHGRIWLDKNYTSGTRFCVEIPKTT